MPVSLENSKLIYRGLKGCGIRLLSALPETWLVHLIQIAEDDPEMRLVRLAKEEEGLRPSAGAHFAGLQPGALPLTRELIGGKLFCASIAFAPFTPILKNVWSSPSWARFPPSFNRLAIAPIFSICSTPWAWLLPQASVSLSVCPIRKSSSSTATARSS